MSTQTKATFDHKNYTIDLRADGNFVVVTTDEADAVTFADKAFSTLVAARAAIDAHVAYLDKKEKNSPKKAKLNFKGITINGTPFVATGIDRRNGNTLIRNDHGATHLDRWASGNYIDTPHVRAVIAKIVALKKAIIETEASIRDARLDLYQVGRYNLDTLEGYNRTIAVVQANLDAQRKTWELTENAAAAFGAPVETNKEEVA